MTETQRPTEGELALVMSGGGARAAYQVGMLRCLARHRPDLELPLLTGVSAGAINAVSLAATEGSFARRVERLASLWSELEVDDVFKVELRDLASSVVGWGAQLLSGGRGGTRVRGMVDTEPLRALLRRALGAEEDHLPGIYANLRRGGLRGIAITASSYSTAQSVTWIQGRQIEPRWQRAHRVAVATRLTVEHVMASAALPLFFPAVEVDGRWYGDGGLRLSAPLSPAVHMGAGRILAISVRHDKSAEEADEPTTDGYPPPAQVIGNLLNAVFLDMFDADALRLRRVNELIAGHPEARPAGQHHVDMLMLRPSVDLGQLAHAYEPKLPRALRFLLRGLGARETRSSDMLSLIMFQPDYLCRLIALGDEDAEARRDELLAFVDGAS